MPAFTPLLLASLSFYSWLKHGSSSLRLYHFRNGAEYYQQYTEYFSQWNMKVKECLGMLVGG
jgi:hypothetical protein